MIQHSRLSQDGDEQGMHTHSMPHSPCQLHHQQPSRVASRRQTSQQTPAVAQKFPRLDIFGISSGHAIGASMQQECAIIKLLGKRD